MLTKAEITSEYIVKTVAPVFNKKGYSGTSMADIAKATGLTKGAIYGNFKNKNELAVKAFIYNINFVISRVEYKIDKEENYLDKLFALSNFYYNYYSFTYSFGGCPILNIGVDSNHQNPELLEKVKKAIHNIQRYIANLINEGIKNNEIKPHIDADTYARRIFTLIEGAIFMSMTLKNEIYMKDLTVTFNSIIKNELKK